MKSLLRISAVALLFLTGCDQNVSTDSIDSVNDADKNYGIKAAQLYLSNYEFSKLAVNKSSDSAILLLSGQIKATSVTGYDKLIYLGRSKGLAVAGTMDEPHMAIRDSLALLTGTAFDSAYIHLTLKDQHKLLEEMNLLISAGNNLSLRGHVEAYKDTFQVYHDIVDSLADNY